MNFIHLIFWLARFFIQFSVEILPHLAHELLFFWLLYFVPHLFLCVAVDVLIDGYCRLIFILKIKKHNSRFLFSLSFSSFACSSIWYADKYHLDDVITLFISCVMWVIIWFCLSSIWLLLIGSTARLLFSPRFFISIANGMRYHSVYFMSFFFSVSLVELSV